MSDKDDLWANWSCKLQKQKQKKGQKKLKSTKNKGNKNKKKRARPADSAAAALAVLTVDVEAEAAIEVAADLVKVAPEKVMQWLRSLDLQTLGRYAKASLAQQAELAVPEGTIGLLIFELIYFILINTNDLL